MSKYVLKCSNEVMNVMRRLYSFIEILKSNMFFFHLFSIMNVNVKAVFNITQTLLPNMNNGGSIVNLSSLAGLRALVNHAFYSASKVLLREHIIPILDGILNSVKF